MNSDPQNADEKHVEQERLAILTQGEDRELTAEELALARADVLRFRKETGDQAASPS